jgi:hypothetical protein
MLQAEKGKEAQTPFCQAELQNNPKLDTDPSRYRKLPYFLIWLFSSN